MKAKFFKINILLFSFLSFFVARTYSQDLYIGPSSFIYVQDVPLFVNDDIRLEAADSYLYLRGDAQLLQNTDTKNSDLGVLSVYQEQTTGIYEYNYWCSPVGVSVNGLTQANLPFNVTNVYDPNDENDLTNINSTAYSFLPSNGGYDSSPIQLASYWLFSLRDADGYNDWVQVGTTGSVASGYGFTLKGTPNPPPPALQDGLNTLDFRGRPNTGNITVSLDYNGDGEPLSEPINQVSTLTGNPYPSALDLKLFFVNSSNNQTNTDGDIYFWQQQAVGSHLLQSYEGGYAVYSPGNLLDLNDNGSYAVATFETYDQYGGNNGGNNGMSTDYSGNNQGRFAAIGQGFLVNGDQPGGFIEFTNSMRVYFPEDSTSGGNGSIFRTSNEKDEVVIMSHNGLDYQDIINNPTIVPEIRIHTHINETYYRESVVAFRNNTDLSYNKFSDALLQSELNNDAFLEAESKKLVIKSVAFNKELRIPFVLKSSVKNSTFSVTINSIKELPKDVEIYLYDGLYDTYTNIKDGTFTITLDEGEHSKRFEITFETKDTLGLTDETLNEFLVFQDNDNARLSIHNPNNLDITSVRLFDVAGKQLLNNLLLDNKVEYHFATNSLSDGVYVVRVELKDQRNLTKKVIIRNK